MSERLRANRRRVLHMLVGLAWLCLGRRGAAARSSRSRGIFDPVLCDAEAAAAVARAFLRVRPREAEPIVLLRALGVPALPLHEVPQGAIRELLAHLAARHREDFRAGRVLLLEGWTLSETELRLCALQHLVSLGESGLPEDVV